MPHKLPPDLVLCSGSTAIKSWVYGDKKEIKSLRKKFSHFVCFLFFYSRKTYLIEKFFFFPSRAVPLDVIKLSCNFVFHSSPMQLDVTDLLAADDERRSVLYEALSQTCKYTVRSALTNAVERRFEFSFHKEESVPRIEDHDAPYWRSWWTWGFPSLAIKQLLFNDLSSTHTVLMPRCLVCLCRMP